MNKTLIQRCLAMSRRIHDGREVSDVQYKLGEEFGELSQELLIAAGKHYKKPGKDGVIGEALDMIVCCVDIIYKHAPNVSEEELAHMIQMKLEKWAEKADMMNLGCVWPAGVYLDPYNWSVVKHEGQWVQCARQPNDRPAQTEEEIGAVQAWIQNTKTKYTLLK